MEPSSEKQDTTLHVSYTLPVLETGLPPHTE